MEVLVVLSRYLHVLAAIIAVGGAIFIRFVLPAGLAQADPSSREAVFLRCRKVFKIMVHACVTFLLLSGAFNTWRNWADYSLKRGIMHGLWGGHVILGLAVVAISLVLLAPAQPRATHKTWMKLNIGLMLGVVLLASTLNFFRTSAIKERMIPPTINVPATPTAPTALAGG